jgi:hypothetical protein
VQTLRSSFRLAAEGRTHKKSPPRTITREQNG